MAPGSSGQVRPTRASTQAQADLQPAPGAMATGQDRLIAIFIQIQRNLNGVYSATTACKRAHNCCTCSRSVGNAPTDTRTIQRPSSVAGVT